MNISLANGILKQLAERGVNEIVLCSGARNSPFVCLLDLSKTFKVYRFFEERSGSFFALGRIKQSGRPVAIITTSGTASAELFPSIIESHYSGLPLVAVTADRPRQCRGTGAPQSINQVGLFGEHVEYSVDIADEEMWTLDNWLAKGPLHINVCFNEPLIDEPVTSISYKVGEPEGLTISSSKIETQRKELSQFMEEYENPLFIVGPLRQNEVESVEEFLSQCKNLILAEALSGLRESARLNQRLLKSGESILSPKYFDSVIRIGGIPTTRFWRDLENNPQLMPVFSLSSQKFPGLSRCQHLQSQLLKLFNGFKPTVPANNEKNASAKLLDQSIYSACDALLDKYPTSEPAMVHRLSLLMGKNAHLYLGNSLPIREWDIFASREENNWVVSGNRGVNGIDGQISSFLGFCSEKHSNWGIFGDLTTMYDLSAPWILDQLSVKDIKLVIINNGGGQIFSRMFSSKTFLNEHSMRFQNWAKMWNINWCRWEQVPSKFEEVEPAVIELSPNAEATKLFWQEYDRFTNVNTQGRII